MPRLSTLSVGAAVTPTVIETSLSHYLNRKPLHKKPTAHISYHVGLNLVRQFLVFASHHTVDEIQSFTSQWVPNPHWVRVEDFAIGKEHINTAVDKLTAQLGPDGIDAVGGATWWQWRREGIPLKAEWIEMRKDYNSRRSNKDLCRRSMLYVHGGAYYFGSVGEHRYQMQRHARKLQARVLAPMYRLAPQFPFPCGLLDCLATYLHMLTIQPPETIILAGDSAGGGMVLSLLVILRDQGIPLPAGAILLSPWSDLTHSFPSVAGNNELDYIPAHGFLHRPSMSWPPPNSDDLAALKQARDSGLKGRAMAQAALGKVHTGEEVTSGLSIEPVTDEKSGATGQIRPSGNLSIVLDGKSVEIKDQIQLYATNSLVSHPLVSPVLQPSLGGLPPLCILVGGGEMLRDEQIYIAHKAANPSRYPPSAAALTKQSATMEDVNRYPPTDVVLQVWEDMCHVAPTLSFTRPAKLMYRSVAQFGAWALSKAQKQAIGIQDDDAISVLSSASSENEVDSGDAIEKPEQSGPRDATRNRMGTNSALVGRAGDDIPSNFVSHMVRQRITRHGEIFPLAPESSLEACCLRPEEVGEIKPGPVRKWLAAQQEWNSKYAKDKRRMQKRRMVEIAAGGYEEFTGEAPPPTALAGRRAKNYNPRPSRQRKSSALAIWSGWGSKHDEETVQREQDMGNVGKKDVVADKETDTAAASVQVPPVQRPVIDNKSVPFSLGNTDTSKNTSTLTLSEENPVVPLTPEPGTALAQHAQDDASVESGAGSGRPTAERFYTAADGLP